MHLQLDTLVRTLEKPELDKEDKAILVDILSFCRWNGHGTFLQMIEQATSGKDQATSGKDLGWPPREPQSTEGKVQAAELLDMCGEWLRSQMAGIKPPRRQLSSGAGGASSKIQEGINLVLCKPNTRGNDTVFESILLLVSLQSTSIRLLCIHLLTSLLLVVWTKRCTTTAGASGGPHLRQPY